MAGNIDIPVGIDVNASELTRALLDVQNGVKGAAEQLNRLLEVTVKKDVFIRTIVDTSGQKKVVAIEKEILAGDKDRLALAKAIQKELKNTEKIQAGSVTSLRQQVNEAAQARDGIAKYKKEANITTINDKWTAQNDKLRELQKQLAAVDASGFWNKLKLEFNVGGIFNFLNGLTGLTQGLQSVSIIVGQFISSINQVSSALANLQSFGLAFDAIGLGAAGANTALSESTRIASNLGVNLATVRNSFQQLSPVVLNSGGSIQDVAAITETLSSRFAAFGITGDRARRVTNGIIQAFAKGKLQAEEFTQQIAEADPAFGTDFAKALNVSTSELAELIKKGKITSKVLLENLPALSKSELLYGKLGSTAQDAARGLTKIDKATGKPLVTLDQVTNKFATLNQLSFENLSRSFSPALYALSELNAILIDFFDNASKSSALKALGSALGSIISGSNVLIKVLLETVNGFIVLIEPIARVIDSLLKLPGASQVVGLAIIANLIGPINTLKGAVISYVTANKLFGAGLIQGISAWKGFGQSIKGVSEQAIGSEQRIARLNNSVTKLQNNLQKASLDKLDKMQRFAGMQQKMDVLRTADPLVVGNTSTQIASLSKEMNNLSQDIAKADTKTRGIQDTLGRTQAKLEAAQASVAQTGNAFTRFGGVAKGAVGAISGAVKGLIAAIGPLGLILIAASVAQGAYSTATKDAQLAMERGTNTIEQYKQLTKSLGDTINEETVGVGALSKGEKLWLAFSVQVRDKIDQIKKSLADLDFSKFAQEGGPIGSLKSLLDFFITGSSDASLATRKFSAEIDTTTVVIRGQISELNKLTIALANYATKAKANKTPVNVTDVALEYKKGSDLIEETKNQVDGLQEKIRILQDLQKKGPTSAKDREQLKAYQKQLKELQLELAAARNKFAEVGDQLGLFTDEQLKQSASAVLILTERMKGFREALDKAGAGTAEFAKNAALISATEQALKRSQDAASDPYVISTGIDRAQLEIINQLSEKYIKLEQELNKPIADRSQESINNFRLEIANLNTDLENLERRRIEINVDLKLKREAVRSDIVSAQAGIQLEPGPVRDITKLQAQTAKEINNASVNFSREAGQARDLIASGALSQEQGSQKVKDSALEFLKNTRIAMENVVARGREFADQLLAAQTSLANLKLSKPEFFTKKEIEDNAKQIRETFQKELERYRQEQQDYSFTPNIQGTEQEQLQQMQDFITTRKEVRSLEETVKNINVALDITTKLLAKIAGVELKTLKVAGLDAAETIQGLVKGYEALDFNPKPVDSFVSSDNSVSFWFDERTKEWIALTDQQEKALNSYKLYQNQIGGEDPSVQQQTSSLQSVVDSLSSSRDSSEQIASNLNSLISSPDEIFTPIRNALEDAELAVYNITKYFKELDGTKVNVTISPSSSSSPQGRWAGGPVSAGQQYQVNELGKEGFLSSSGVLSQINAPLNSTWRAPASGTVIPANIWNKINAPNGKISASKALNNMTGIRNQNEQFASIAKEMNSTLIASQANTELVAIQAQQAIEIGKLSSSVEKLAAKKWNVQVNVSPKSDISYLNRMNHRL